MATSKKPSSPFKFDKFIDSVRPDPKSTSAVTILNGYIGKSSEKDCVRMYRDAALNHFIEIPLDAILYALPNSYEDNPLGGSRLWVKSDATIIGGDPNMAERPKGNFLQGSLYDKYAGNYPGTAPGNYSPITKGGQSICICNPVTLGGESVCIICDPITQGGKSVCLKCKPTEKPGCLPCTNIETTCDIWPTQNHGCTYPPDCPNGWTCVKTCNDNFCFEKTHPKTCPPTRDPMGCPTDPPKCQTCRETCGPGANCLEYTDPRTCKPTASPNCPTVPGGPACTIEARRNPGYGFGTFNPYM